MATDTTPQEQQDFVPNPEILTILNGLSDKLSESRTAYEKGDFKEAYIALAKLGTAIVIAHLQAIKDDPDAVADFLQHVLSTAFGPDAMVMAGTGPLPPFLTGEGGPVLHD